MPKKKPHQRTPRQRKKPYAILSVPRWSDSETLPTLRLSPRLVFVRPLAFVMVNDEVVAICRDNMRAREWAAENITVSRKLVRIKATH